MQQAPDMKGRVILEIFSHHDDTDLYAGGSNARWTKEGATVYTAIPTHGGKGAWLRLQEKTKDITEEEIKEIRRQEQFEAAKKTGLKDVFFGNFEDARLENGPELQSFITECIRKTQPDVIVTFDPSPIYWSVDVINHRDHRILGQTAIDCAYTFAKNPLFFPAQIEEGLSAHRTKSIYLVHFDEPNTYVDITDTLKTKLDAIACHQSQNPARLLDLAQKWAYQIAERAGLNTGEKILAQATLERTDPKASELLKPAAESFRAITPV